MVGRKGGGALCQCERPLSTGREKWIIGAMNSLSHVMISSLLQRNLETPESPDASKPGRGRVRAQGGVFHCAHIFAHLMLQPHLRRSENVPIPANGSVHSSERRIYMQRRELHPSLLGSNREYPSAAQACRCTAVVCCTARASASRIPHSTHSRPRHSLRRVPLAPLAHSTYLPTYPVSTVSTTGPQYLPTCLPGEYR